MRIVVFSNIPSPYFVEYLNELGKYVSILAVFERRTASDRDKRWRPGNSNFDYVFLDGLVVGTETAFSFKIVSIIKQHRNDVLIFANPMTPSGVLGIFYCKFHNIRYVLQSEGGLVKEGRGLRENIKRSVVKDARLCLSGMSPAKDYFIGYGADPTKVKQYPFSSLHKSDLLEIVPTEAEKQKYKAELGILYKRILIYVGRMLPVKGVDVLLSALKGFDDIGVYLIGGKETKEYLEIRKKEGIKNVHYVDHLGLETLKKYYIAADLLVLPTRCDTWGLVVNEAMAFGLPVITTTSCVAGLELIRNGINGFLVKSEDSLELHEKIKYCFDNPELCKEMGSNNLEKIKSYTYENMSRTIHSALLEFEKDLAEYV